MKKTGGNEEFELHRGCSDRKAGTTFLLLSLSCFVRFPDLGLNFPAYPLVRPRLRLNSFGTLDLKIFGKKALKSIAVYLKWPRRRRETNLCKKTAIKIF